MLERFAGSFGFVSVPLSVQRAGGFFNDFFCMVSVGRLNFCVFNTCGVGYVREMWSMVRLYFISHRALLAQVNGLGWRCKKICCSSGHPGSLFSVGVCEGVLCVAMVVWGLFSSMWRLWCRKICCCQVQCLGCPLCKIIIRNCFFVFFSLVVGSGTGHDFFLFLFGRH